MTNDARETSGATTTLLLGHVRTQGGDEAVAEVLRLAGVPQSLSELEDGASWFAHEVRTRLFEAATAVLGEGTVFAVGVHALDNGLQPALVGLLRSLGNPREVYRQVPRALPKFTTRSEMEVVSSTTTSAVVHLRTKGEHLRSRLDCELVQGMLAAVPQIFGQPLARIVQSTCQADGHEQCEFQISWTRPRRWFDRSRSERSARSADVELAALRGQLEELQRASSDLVSSDDVHTVLERIVDRAATAVLAPSYLLVAHGDPATGAGPVVHARGLSPERAEELAAALSRGESLGQAAVVVDVTSTRRHHGRLAAIYSEGHRPLAADEHLLEAYARHAAAALDLLTALDGSRREASRATALLDLAHQLAAATDADAVARVVTDAMPGIVGCQSGGVWMWEPSEGILRAAATTGHEEHEALEIMGTRLRPDDTPELTDILTRHDLLVIDAQDASPRLGALLDRVGSRSVVVAPLVAGDSFMGVAIASWATPADRLAVGAEAMARISGVGDQTATALQNARLLSRVSHQALHDALTGVPNRVLFSRSLDESLRRAEPGQGTAVLFCDLDNFKHVNDQHGHAAGDELLRQVAARLRGELRPGDVVGRLSGDEFAVLLHGVDDDEHALTVAARLVAGLDHPFRVDGHEVRTTASVGVAVHVGADGRGDRLLAAADAAMYEAKQRGRNQVLLAGELDPRRGAPSLEAELSQAVEAGQLRLFFQPVVDVSPGTGDAVVGAEALIRWAHPRLGLLAPAAFLPLAEEAGLVTELDLWAVGAACEALAGWSRAGAGEPAAEALPVEPLRVAVNLAGATLVDPRLVPTVRQALSRNGLTSDRLHLEVVESRSLSDLPGVIERLVELRQIGVRISLDDFGTGFSTLAWLQSLPVDQIKIDRSFIAGLPDHAASLALVRGVVALARELGIEVIAEGVEEPAQLALLREAGCEMVQGYLLGRPAPVFSASERSTPA
ncbi:EAL domain-containing protein [Actinotalea sp. BY-33]|uniref:EAL domain-containing protein n=1 Tax=Actinotalea soli TaxID=2819234 RepID=A0A939LTE0_9CELL|nr:EAL domain-containing protein [Actinotalea soli]MBO1750992.1 EAL domain-containing protein [Actinotalea soli]